MKVALGIDISQKTANCCLFVNNESKECVHKVVIKNALSGVSQLSRWLTSKGYSLEGMSVIMEATGKLHLTLARDLSQNKAIVGVMNPKAVSAYRESLGIMSKNDSIDSQVLGRMGCERKIKHSWHEPSSECQYLMELLTARASAVNACTREKNKLAMTLDSEKTAAKLHKQAIKFYTKQKKDIEAAITKHCSGFKYLSEDIALLSTIPGIGSLNAQMLTYYLRAKDFQSAEQLAAFVGLVPCDHDSGSSVHGKTALKHKGPCIFRSVLCQAAHTCIRKDVRNNESLRAFYDRLIAKGKTEQAAICAVMRKLLHVAYTIWKTRIPFNPDYAKQKAKLALQDAADSPCLERKRARRPSRTRSEEHKQDEGVKAARAKRAPLEEVALTPKALVLPQGKQGQGALKQKTRAKKVIQTA